MVIDWRTVATSVAAKPTSAVDEAASAESADTAADLSASLSPGSWSSFALTASAVEFKRSSLATSCRRSLAFRKAAACLASRSWSSARPAASTMASAFSWQQSSSKRPETYGAAFSATRGLSSSSLTRTNSGIVAFRSASRDDAIDDPTRIASRDTPTTAADVSSVPMITLRLTSLNAADDASSCAACHRCMHPRRLNATSCAHRSVATYGRNSHSTALPAASTARVIKLPTTTVFASRIPPDGLSSFQP
mmetsp:Transcript_20141/g.63320  ORF Transcript_20141/g.63320 Transcript_20141/m.63320 type:complete len:250 (+) Transcript_20141:922-1671(+)